MWVFRMLHNLLSLSLSLSLIPELPPRIIDFSAQTKEISDFSLHDQWCDEVSMVWKWEVCGGAGASWLTGPPSPCQFPHPSLTNVIYLNTPPISSCNPPTQAQFMLSIFGASRKKIAQRQHFQLNKGGDHREYILLQPGNKQPWLQLKRMI